MHKNVPLALFLMIVTLVAGVALAYNLAYPPPPPDRSKETPWVTPPPPPPPVVHTLYEGIGDELFDSNYMASNWARERMTADQLRVSRFAVRYGNAQFKQDRLQRYQYNGFSNAQSYDTFSQYYNSSDFTYFTITLVISNTQNSLYETQVLSYTDILYLLSINPDYMRYSVIDTALEAARDGFYDLKGSESWKRWLPWYQ